MNSEISIDFNGKRYSARAKNPDVAIDLLLAHIIADKHSPERQGRKKNRKKRSKTSSSRPKRNVPLNHLNRDLQEGCLDMNNPEQRGLIIRSVLELIANLKI